ncbi:hypothetical protein G647_09787 [Cladophialophora carrionii CBS 160.54]|uniref:Heterokaryon incompatibility domain-containing protein n=1 Tax=Cladophialophora carrionii CBS 160.54 TaxID=1279043 RepID=V9DJR4_9EURO|nr:uncharacterized protein G647_09787 [Cladophialophora carrionii CBS 160.54]ETI27105.1 hypothetical protein G647_09787 [Cladophialophora carrionii CBS 160.54]
MDDRGFILDGHATARDVYSTLHGDEIRTLLLAPGKNTPIVCELQVIPSPSSAQFEALSYVWGDTAKSNAISCNGFEFTVTESLYTALTHLRYPDSWRRLWVDQLCINQLEDHELMKQVAMMGKLYSSACRVIVWLGMYDQKMSFAFDLVQETSLSSSLVRSDFLHSSSGPSTPRRKSLPPRNTPRSAGFSRRSSRASSSRESLTSLSASTSSLDSHSYQASRPKNRRNNTPPALKHALSIFQHVYFSRKWTFQEIILAKAAIICCGDLEMAWSDLSLWYFHYASKLRSSSLLYDSDGAFENILKVRNELDKGTLTLSNLLMLTRPRLSTKPEDAVYALLGLVPDLVPSLNRTFDAIASSGEEDLFRLYLEVFRHCIDKEQDLAILSAAGRYRGNVQAGNWPGWLPDWRQKLPLRPLVLNNPTTLGPESAFDEEVPFSSSTPSERVQPLLYKLHFDPAMLPLSSRRLSMVVTGVRLGCIVTRPLAWPGSFLVADSLGRSALEDVFAMGEDKYSQPLASLAPSFTTLLHQSQTVRGSKVEQNYSAKLIQSSLEAGARCCAVRTSAMVETGDLICAFTGGKVLFAIRPLQGERNSGRNHVVKRGPRGKRKLQGSSTRTATSSSADAPHWSLKCLFLGECAVHGLNPAELLGHQVDEEEMMEFELT